MTRKTTIQLIVFSMLVSLFIPPALFFYVYLGSNELNFNITPWAYVREIESYVVNFNTLPTSYFEFFFNVTTVGLGAYFFTKSQNERWPPLTTAATILLLLTLITSLALMGLIPIDEPGITKGNHNTCEKDQDPNICGAYTILRSWCVHSFQMSSSYLALILGLQQLDVSDTELPTGND